MLIHYDDALIFLFGLYFIDKKPSKSEKSASRYSLLIRTGGCNTSVNLAMTFCWFGVARNTDDSSFILNNIQKWNYKYRMELSLYKLPNHNNFFTFVKNESKIYIAYIHVYARTIVLSGPTVNPSRDSALHALLVFLCVVL